MKILYQALPALLLYAFLAPANAASPDQVAAGYQQMCMQAADMPKPYGEWDLKGNPKLTAYCECFSPLFAKRAMAAAQRMQAGQQPPPLEQSQKEELAMRNTCRSQTGLPQVPPKK
jgi:hypothetical protein